MFRRRRKNRTATSTWAPSSWVEERDRKIEEQAETIEAFKDGINALIDSHEPRMDASAREHVHPGWDSDRIVFYCKRCSTQWPCRTVNDLRALYGTATGWEPATVPYAPLTLRLDTPENMTVEDTRRAETRRQSEARAAEKAAAKAAAKAEEKAEEAGQVEESA